jgi:hypothetical protein
MRRRPNVSLTSRERVARVDWPLFPKISANDKEIEAWNKPRSAFPMCNDGEFVFERRKAG